MRRNLCTLAVLSVGLFGAWGCSSSAAPPPAGAPDASSSAASCGDGGSGALTATGACGFSVVSAGAVVNAGALTVTISSQPLRLILPATSVCALSPQAGSREVTLRFPRAAIPGTFEVTGNVVGPVPDGKVMVEYAESGPESRSGYGAGGGMATLTKVDGQGVEGTFKVTIDGLSCALDASFRASGCCDRP